MSVPKLRTTSPGCVAAGGAGRCAGLMLLAAEEEARLGSEMEMDMLGRGGKDFWGSEGEGVKTAVEAEVVRVEL